MSERVNIFDDSEIDISGFEPRPAGNRQPGPSQADLRRISEGSSFVSRDPQRTAAPTPGEAAVTVRKQRTYRTGRNVQFNTKAKATTVEAFDRFMDELRLSKAESLEFAAAALNYFVGLQNLDPELSADFKEKISELRRRFQGREQADH